MEEAGVAARGDLVVLPTLMSALNQRGGRGQNDVGVGCALCCHPPEMEHGLDSSRGRSIAKNIVLEHLARTPGSAGHSVRHPVPDHSC